jgi:NAD(P)-dependent dehydrogenase (short-subunit alcohol dehydrogenase family)
MTELTGTTALVTGASRGFGRAIAATLCKAGANTVGIARDRAGLDEAHSQLGDAFTPIAADVTDPVVAGQLIDRYAPQVLVLTAGASPLLRPLSQHSWQSFSRTWDVDVRQTFHWVREALARPLRPGSVVVTFSSAAAFGGSPLTGGYAGAKATIMFLTSYAAKESQQAGLGIRFVAVAPTLTPATGLGKYAVTEYARRRGISAEQFLAGLGTPLTAELVGEAVADLASDPTLDHPVYKLAATGLAPVDDSFGR